MKIESYSYGLMSIDGKNYDKDLIIFPDRILPNWWRKEGHTGFLSYLLIAEKSQKKAVAAGLLIPEKL